MPRPTSCEAAIRSGSCRVTATGATLFFEVGLAPPPDPANLVHENAVGHFVQIRRREGPVSLTTGRLPLNDLHHAHHRRLHQIIALIGKPARTEPGDGARQIRLQL